MDTIQSVSVTKNVSTTGAPLARRIFLNEKRNMIQWRV